MFVNVDKQQDIARFSGDFFSLVDIDDTGNLTVEVLYRIKQSDVVLKDATKVRIINSTNAPRSVDVVRTQPDASIDSAQVISNILTLVPSTRSAIQNSLNNVVSIIFSDNTSRVDNSVINLLRQGIPPSQIPQLNVSKPVVMSVQQLNSSNITSPLLQVNSEPIQPQNLPTSTRHLLQSALVSEGLDPSDVLDFDDNNLRPGEAINGVSSRVTANQVKFSNSALAEYYRRITVPSDQISTISSADLLADKKVVVLVPTSIDEVEITRRFILNVDKITNTDGSYADLFMKFDVLDSNGLSIQTNQLNVNLSEHVQIFHTPKIPPVVKVSNFDAVNFANLQVRQCDPNAKSVRIYRKDFFYVVNTVDQYHFVGEFTINSSSGLVTIPVPASGNHSIVYRIIPVGARGEIGSVYTNVIVKPTQANKQLTYVSLTTMITATGVNVEIREVPLGVVSFNILRRDMSLFETQFSLVGDDVVQVDPSNDNATYIVADSDVKTGHLYEYVCRFIYQNGSQVQTGNEIIEYQPLVENFVSITLSNTQVTHDVNNLDVSFSVSSIINDSDLDVINNLLQKQGLAEFFAEDILKERDNLKQLIAHHVQRIDLTTGLREDFGVITTNEFSDSKLRVNNSVDPIQVGHQYRYEISTLLRFTETLFTKLVKTVQSLTSKRTYTYSPFKFLHPIVLTLGNLNTPETLAAHYPKSQMSFGAVGNLKTLDVSFFGNISSMLDATVEQFEQGSNIIKWKTKGNNNTIDHFVVMKEILGQRIVIGRAHSNFEKAAIQFIHRLSSDDIGELTYVIVPVFNTYIVGTEIKTNRIVVE